MRSASLDDLPEACSECTPLFKTPEDVSHFAAAQFQGVGNPFVALTIFM